jgi:hypothetical protein
MNQGQSNATSNSPAVIPVEIKVDQDNFLVTGDGQELYVFKVTDAKYDDEWLTDERDLIRQWVPLRAPAVSTEATLVLGQRDRPANKTKRSYAQVTIGSNQLPLYTYTGGPDNPLLQQWRQAHLETDAQGDATDGDSRPAGGQNGP